MTQPKYKIGDKVWWIETNQVKTGEIVHIQPDTNFMIKKTWGGFVGFVEKSEFGLFPSKEELLASL